MQRNWEVKVIWNDLSTRDYWGSKNVSNCSNWILSFATLLYLSTWSDCQQMIIYLFWHRKLPANLVKLKHVLWPSITANEALWFPHFRFDMKMCHCDLWRIIVVLPEIVFVFHVVVWKTCFYFWYLWFIFSKD